MRMVIATAGGWIVGAVLSTWFVVPMIAETIHRLDPVYAHPDMIAFECLVDGSTVVTGRSEKHRAFTVSTEEPGYLRITYEIDGKVFGLSHPLVNAQGGIEGTRPIYVPGDTFAVGPFKFPPLPVKASSIEVNVSLPGVRFGFYDTKAAIGPMRGIVNCAQAL